MPATNALEQLLQRREPLEGQVERITVMVGYQETTTTTTRAPTRTTRARTRTTTRTTRRVTTTTRVQLTPEDVAEKCFSPWDGNHNGFERQIKAGLNDPGSMDTDGTYFFPNWEDLSDGTMTIRLDYRARNAFGGMVRTSAWGEMNIHTCSVTVTDFGYGG